EQGPEGLGDAAVPPDHLAHVVFGHVQLDDGAFLVLALGDLHGIVFVDERPGDVLDELLRAHFALPFAAFSAGRTPADRNRRATPAAGSAPLRRPAPAHLPTLVPRTP